jgi:hypothetical protein
MKYKIKLRKYIGGFDIENYKTYYVGMHGEINGNPDIFNNYPIKIPDNCIVIMPFCCGYESSGWDSRIYNNKDLEILKNAIKEDKKKFIYDNKLYNIYYPGDYICDILFSYENITGVFLNTFINNWGDDDIIAMNLDNKIINKNLYKYLEDKNFNNKDKKYEKILQLVYTETNLYRFIYTIIHISHFIDFNENINLETLILNIKHKISEVKISTKNIMNNFKIFCSKIERNYGRDDINDDYEKIIDFYDDIISDHPQVKGYTKRLLERIYMNFIDELYDTYSKLGFSTIEINKLSEIFSIPHKKILFVDSCQSISSEKFCIKTLCMYLFNNRNSEMIDKYIKYFESGEIDKVFNNINYDNIRASFWTSQNIKNREIDEIENIFNDILTDVDINEKQKTFMMNINKIFKNKKIIKNFLKIMVDYIEYLNFNMESMINESNYFQTIKFIFNILIIANYDQNDNLKKYIVEKSKLDTSKVDNIILILKELWNI